MLVIIDAKPKDLGLPTEAYVAVEEVHDVSITTTFNPNFYIMGLQYDVYQGQFNSRFSWGGGGATKNLARLCSSSAMVLGYGLVILHTKLWLTVLCLAF